MSKKGLLIIDIQNDYMPGGLFPLEGAVEAAENAAKVKKFFNDNNLPVFVIDHESVGESASFFFPGSEGQKVADVVKATGNDVVIRKNFPNSFLKTELEKKLQEHGVEELVITGMMTFMCVDATTRAAVDLGYPCTLVHDATAARSLAVGEKEVAAEDVQAAFTAALAFLCKQVVATDEFVGAN